MRFRPLAEADIAMAEASGAESAWLAKHGVQGTRDIFEDDWGGLGQVYAAGEPDAEALTADLGNRWVAYDASIKAFPSCASSHRMIQLAERGLVPEQLDLDSISWIVITLSPLVADMCGETRMSRLETFRQRQLSIPYGVALTLTEGSMTFDGLFAQPSAETTLAALLEKTEVVVDESILSAHGEGTVSVHRGSRVEAFTTDSVADPRCNITSIEQVLDKAEGMLRSVAMEERFEPLLQLANAPGTALAAPFFARI